MAYPSLNITKKPYIHSAFKFYKCSLHQESQKEPKTMGYVLIFRDTSIWDQCVGLQTTAV